jgi:hypothetical protein
MTDYEAPGREDEGGEETDEEEREDDLGPDDLTPTEGRQEAIEHPIPVRPKAPPAPPRGPRRKPRRDIGQPHQKPALAWSHREAPLMWGEMLGDEHPMALSRREPALSAFDVACEVLQLDSGRNAVWLGSFDGAAVMGSQTATPGEQLVNYLIDKFHSQLSPNQGPAEYEIRFVRKIDNRILGRGKLPLPSMLQINNMRRARMTDTSQPSYAPSAYAQMPQGIQPGAGYSPPSGPVYTSTGYAPPAPAQGFGAGASPRAMELEVELQRLREREAMLRGQLEAERGARTRAEAREPVRHEESEEDREVRIAAKVVRMLGIRPAGGAPAGQTAGAQPVGTGAAPGGRGFGGTVRSLIDQSAETLDAFEQMLAQQDKLEHFVKKAGRRYGLEPTAHEEARAEVIDEEAERAAKEAEDLPFAVMEIPETSWRGNPNVKYAKDKETGDISLVGLAAANPQYVVPLVEKLLTGVGDLAKIIGQIIVPKAPGPQGAEAGQEGQPAEVVSAIPQAAEEGSPPNGAPNHTSGW